VRYFPLCDNLRLIEHFANLSNCVGKFTQKNNIQPQIIKLFFNAMLISYIHQNIVISTHALYTERRPAPNGTDLLLFNYSSLNIMPEV
jgi:hypothetical protein